MNTVKIKTITMSTALLFLSLMSNAQTVHYKIGDNTKITVSGTSTLHDWESDVTKYEGSADIENNLASSEKIKKNDKIKSFEIKIQVDGIISGRGETMDSRTFKALKYEEHPNITFTLSDSDIKNVDGAKFTLLARGDLEIAGQTKAIEMTIAGERLSPDKFKFNGSYKLNMKDYGVEPPTAMFGQIVCGEEVEIKFDLELVKG